MGRRRIGACALALFVAGAVATTPAMDASAASLQKQINQLKARVTKLERAFDDMQACQTVVPIAQYGDPTGVGEGYVYWIDENTLITTSALDYVPNTSAGGSFDWIISVDDSCVEARTAARTGVAWRPAEPHPWAGKTASLRRTILR